MSPSGLREVGADLADAAHRHRTRGAASGGSTWEFGWPVEPPLAHMFCPYLRPYSSRPYFLSLQRGARHRSRRTPRTRGRSRRYATALAGHGEGSYTIFEGTSEIQRLVVARAISGIHIP
jgi:hypothetical protein